MIRYLILFVLILIALLQLYVLFFGRRKKRKLRKRLAVTCCTFLAVYFIPTIAFDHSKGAIFTAMAGETKETEEIEEIEETGYPASVGTKGQIVYYNQEDPRWGQKTYGPVDKIEDTGCGPTVVAMAVSSLTGNKIDPEEMCRWAYLNGYCSIGYGSYHSFIAEGLEHFGIGCSITNEREKVKAALEKGTPVIALMGEGHFTSGGHFILLCEMDAEEKVTVADPKSVERTKKKWDFEIIAEEAKSSPATGGAFWGLDV